MLKSKQKQFLRKLGMVLEPIVFVGKGEISENLIIQLNEALTAKELVKIKVLKNCIVPVEDIAEELVDATQAELVQIIGKAILLYRLNKEKTKILLPE